MYNPLGAGFAWGVNTPQLQAGDRITILGCGQRGLCAVIAAREAGAGQILITGLAKDEYERAIQTLAGAFPMSKLCTSPSCPNPNQCSLWQGICVWCLD